MDFIKNNWGFLILVLILMGGVITLGVLCSSSAAELQKEKDEVKKKVDYIDSVAKKKIELSDENVKIAQRNEKEILKGVKVMQEDLKKKFRLEFEVPASPIEGLRKLKDELEDLRKLLDDNNIEYSASCEYFTFENIARATNPPHPDDLSEIFRQLAIIKYVVGIAVKAEVTAIEDIQRPLGLTVQDEGTYTFTPIEVTIAANPEHAQRFVNMMDRADKYLFFLRNLELTAADTPTEMGADIHDEAINATSGVGGGVGPGAGMGRADRGGPMIGMEMGGPGMGGPGMGGRGRRRGGAGADMMGGPNPAMMGGPNPAMMGGPNPAMMGGPNPGMAGGPNPGMAGGPMDNQMLVDVPMKRQDLLAYEAKETIWKLRFDLIEFNQEESENAEGDSEAADDDSSSDEEDSEEQAD